MKEREIEKLCKEDGLRRLDFENEWTIRMEDKFRKIWSEIAKEIYADIRVETNDFTLADMLAHPIPIVQEARLVALMYVEVDGKWTEKAYEARVERFLNMPIQRYEKYKEAIKDFSLGRLRSIRDDFLTYLNMGTIEKPST